MMVQAVESEPRDRKAIAKDFNTLRRFVEVYCNRQHRTNGENVCSGCVDLLEYARKRLESCPHNPKPKCKDCETHCYNPSQRKKVKEIMRYSGMHFVKRGRLDWMIKYFL